MLLAGCKKEVPSTVPTIITSVVSSIESTAVVIGGEITSTGGAAVTEQGVCWSKAVDPTIQNSKVLDATGSQVFSVSITGLTAGTTYHVRAYAKNMVGTSYGADVPFRTGITLPTLSTSAASSITKTTAQSGGSITSDGGATITAKGICWSTSANPTISDSKTSDGVGIDAYSTVITNLASGTTFHIRAYATNSAGTGYGSDLLFSTLVDVVIGGDNDNMLLGNPSGATADIVNANNYLMVIPQYTESYSNARLIPNWTSWHLYLGDIGATARQDDYRANVTLPSGWYQVGGSDYLYSTFGFDRGHMCPSADRTLTVADNSATFLMTNMIPQAPYNNQQTWQNLESYSRSLIDAGNELYIISGSSGQGGTSAKGTFNTLSTGVTVPAYTWKIIVVMANGNNDLSRVSNTTRVIAVWMPNTQTISSVWTTYRVSVDYIETQTGYNFLSNVPTNIQSLIEASVDNL
jgi:endonuclease G